MALPKVFYAQHNIEIPSTKKKSPFRPWLVKEEKILLMAKESADPKESLMAVKQVVQNCSVDPKFNTNDLTIFDLEYLFLKIRAISVDNITTVSFEDAEDKKVRDFRIDLNNVEISFPEKIDNVIKVTDNISIKMKYPSAKLYDDEDFLSLKKGDLFDLITKCIDSIYEGEEVHEVKNFKLKEISDFVESLSSKTFDDIKQFLIDSPSLREIIKYTNDMGRERVIVLSSLSDFFTWR